MSNEEKEAQVEMYAEVSKTHEVNGQLLLGVTSG